MSLEKTLKGLDYTDKEIKVYLTLLRIGKATPAQVSRISKINRATVYSTAKSLISKGVITEDLGGKTLYLIPNSSDKLLQGIEKAKEELGNKEVLVKKAIEEISLITHDKQYPVPKLRFVEEGDIEDFLCENTEKWFETMKPNEPMWGFQDHGFVEKYEKWIAWASKFAPKVNLFSNLTSVEKTIKEKYKVREVRYLENTFFTASTWVMGEYLVMIVTQQKPFYLFEIHDKTLAHNMEEVFKQLWKKIN
jgi:predicted transcriptional regulator